MTVNTLLKKDPAPPVVLLQTYPTAAPNNGDSLVSTLQWNNLIDILNGIAADKVELSALSVVVEVLSNKGIANGYAGLDSSGNITNNLASKTQVPNLDESQITNLIANLNGKADLVSGVVPTVELPTTLVYINGNNIFTQINKFTDIGFAIYNVSDATKVIEFDASAAGSGSLGLIKSLVSLNQTRSWSFPDKDGTVAMLSDVPTLPISESNVTNLVTDLAGKASTAHKNTHKTGGSDAFVLADLLDCLARVNVLLGGVSTGSRRGLNFIAGSGITITQVDDNANEKVDVTIKRSTPVLVGTWDFSQTKTNIGTAFVDIYTQANSDGHSATVDTHGFTQVRLVVNWNKIGTGTQTVQVIDVVGSVVLLSFNVVSGNNDSGFVNIPAGLLNAEKRYKLQAKSSLAADDPVFEGAQLWLK